MRPLFFQPTDQNPVTTANLVLAIGYTDVSGAEQIVDVEISFSSPVVSAIIQSINDTNTALQGIALNAQMIGGRLNIKVQGELVEGSLQWLAVKDIRSLLTVLSPGRGTLGCRTGSRCGRARASPAQNRPP